ncbi:hypothetical protein [Bordetella sp. FB-8]|uniref:hypothetical protein n=1 Tax=Bordetella sp. FB-8 TaxID=1159870 RepID=UPI00036DB864|nr:hypothetical protein [Bordetella sp. FB-8]
MGWKVIESLRPIVEKRRVVFSQQGREGVRSKAGVTQRGKTEKAIVRGAGLVQKGEPRETRLQ